MIAAAVYLAVMAVLLPSVLPAITGMMHDVHASCAGGHDSEHDQPTVPTDHDHHDDAVPCDPDGCCCWFHAYCGAASQAPEAMVVLLPNGLPQVCRAYFERVIPDQLAHAPEPPPIRLV